MDPVDPWIRWIRGSATLSLNFESGGQLITDPHRFKLSINTGVTVKEQYLYKYFML